jgi:hypothetical protein
VGFLFAMICANPKCGKEFDQKRKDKIYCSKTCYESVYRSINKVRDLEKKRLYNKRYRIKKGLSGLKSSLFQFCKFCNTEHLRSKDNHYIHQPKGKKTAQFICKKYAKYLSYSIRVVSPNNYIKYRKKWRIINRDKYLSGRRKRENEKTKNLTDSYLRKILHRNAPPELIELKRIQLKINRITKTKQL